MIRQRMGRGTDEDERMRGVVVVEPVWMVLASGVNKINLGHKCIVYWMNSVLYMWYRTGRGSVACVTLQQELFSCWCPALINNNLGRPGGVAEILTRAAHHVKNTNYK